jgi:hypothetical protein
MPACVDCAAYDRRGTSAKMPRAVVACFSEPARDGQHLASKGIVTRDALSDRACDRFAPAPEALAATRRAWIKADPQVAAVAELIASENHMKRKLAA